MKVVRRAGCFVILLLMLINSGCAAPPVKKERYFWPPPPDTPRIEWLGSYRGDRDLKGEGASTLDRFIGAEETLSLKRAMYVSADGKGTFYAGDLLLMDFLVFDLNTKSVHKLGEKSGVGSFELPTGVAVDDEGTIYAADGNKRKIYVLDRNEKIKSTIDLSKKMTSIGAIAVDKVRKHLIVPDVKAHKILIYDLATASVLNFVGDSTPGEGNGQFNYPSAVAVDAKGNIWVCDSMNARIQQFSPEGRFLSKFGQRGDGMGDFSMIKALAIDSAGHIYVTDGKANRINIYDEKGVNLFVFGGTHSYGGNASGEVAPGGFLLPQGIYVDQNDKIYIVDQLNARVQIFQYVTEKYLKEHPVTADAPPAKASLPPSSGKKGGKK